MDRKSKKFHTYVYKVLFICKRARPDIHTGVAALTTRIKKPTEDDWNKLRRIVWYLNGTKKDKLIFSADNLHIIKWYVDTSLAVHPDFKSHTGGGMTMGVGFPISVSRKQKFDTKIICESEIVGTDYLSTLVLWTKLFMEAQGYLTLKNFYQDNKSTILLINNGKRSSGRNTRAFNIRYFFLTDQVEKGNLSIEYYPTNDMVADFWTKPLQGAKFKKFKKFIMGETSNLQA